MSKKYRTSFLIMICLLWGSASGIIIRHDTGPTRYEVRPSDYPAVFFLERQGGRKICVATVIHQRWAITAAHCADETMLSNTLDNGRRFAVQVGSQAREIDALIVHPDYDISSANDVDLALIRFREAAAVPRLVPLQVEDNELGEIVSLIGWGYFGLGTTGRQYDDGCMRLAQNRITVAERRLRIEFEDPRPANSATLELEGMPSLGDSGGPLLIASGIGFRLAGVAVGESKGADFSEETQGKYGSVAIYERISLHIDWIETVIGSKLPFDS
jgi:secreted trypsin-like serine protease